MAAQRKNFVVETKKRGLNLRAEPSMESEILTLLPNGSKVVIDPTADVPEGWAAVQSGGYVVRRFLK